MECNVWMTVITDNSRYILFNFNHGCEWIYEWFKCEISELDKRFGDNLEYQISSDVVMDFLRDCVEIAFDPFRYYSIKPERLSIVLNRSNNKRVIYEIQFMAGKVLNCLFKHIDDVSFGAEFYLGIEF